MADEQQEAVDYLGRESPVSLSGKPSLPVGGAPVGVAAAPQTTTTGTTAAPPTATGAVIPSLEGAPTAATGGWSVPEIPGFGPQQALSLLSQGFRLQDFASRIFGGSGPPGLTAGEIAAQGGEGGVAAGIDEAVNQGLGATEAGGVASEAVGLAPETLAGAFSTLGVAAPTWAALTAAVDLLGEGTIPGRALLNSIFHFDDPSQEWRSFGGRLHDTFATNEAADQQLAQDLATATGQGAIQSAVDKWRTATKAPGIGLEIGDLPGATYKPHEWKQQVDFSPEVFGLRDELQAALAGASPDQRIQALMKAVKARRDTLSSEQAARDAAEAQRQADADRATLMAGGA